MAKGGKLTKLKSVLKKWNSFSKLGRLTNATSVVAAAGSHSSSDDEDSYNSKNHMINRSRDLLRPVYVGKSRRRYLVGSDIIDNPVFRELVERSGDNDDDSITVVNCEVVLFEHLLWMLQNAAPPPESLTEFVEYYAC
ncbi:hypothetical protein Acr_00g0057780 [Actinidia rufa]|uniref:SAUR-like auxin-responsive protein family n=1 Tax=Actinidia rufa TaxID=165716 RepID=A0A7J0DN80_9ERIC|nr:hypothetical protein Acr_00g0057780 [Actinidia rufa]